MAGKMQFNPDVPAAGTTIGCPKQGCVNGIVWYQKEEVYRACKTCAGTNKLLFLGEATCDGDSKLVFVPIRTYKDPNPVLAAVQVSDSPPAA
jgi:hypothetical protein